MVFDPPNEPVEAANSRPLSVSLCTTCMGRAADLIRTLPVNLELHARDPHVEFVVLDYNSNDGLGQWIRDHLWHEIESGRLSYFRTDEPQHYSMTHSRNVAFKAAAGDIVCSVDADNYTVNTSLSLEARPTACFAEHIRSLAVRYGRKLIFAKDRKAMRGRLGFFREEFINLLGGYDESLTGYGYDDHDLCNRALQLGFSFVNFDSAFYSRIHTPKRLRGVHMADPQWRRTETANRVASEENLARGICVANAGKPWGVARLRKNFTEELELV